ncbi:glycosyltransferase [Desulfocurvibacter africanus PCS]|uniref:Glycosyltransferase n=1 Tax=Desulfocurvibacter africanus PCS TaxID=1262666 RepID=M5Q2W0_DESAF|nr:glycosyltransferase family 4 protein [Desulfocurvibacter africanus]EMG38816.1 glycosyltransferase [Desulfocurvibacter africanus PCS]
MRIAFYAPFKPLGHPNPSGDLTIGTGLHDFLSRGNEVIQVSRLRSRWIYWKPWQWPQVCLERLQVERAAKGCDLWLTYHTYYKAPDLLGPACARRLGVPYAVFQGIYSTKTRRSLKTCPGFLLNRAALRAASVVFSNKRDDLTNLARIIPKDRLRYIPPGIFPEQFVFSPDSRERLRKEWGTEDRPVILSAAMFRDDVKTQGLTFLLKACGKIAAQGRDFLLTLAGDGVMRPHLEALAREQLPDRVIFLGQVPRKKLFEHYSAADVFAFPGIRESLGMVFLEAQSCGLPVVAFDGWGIPEVVANGETGLLCPPFNEDAFRAALAKLLDDAMLRRSMGRTAADRVRLHHDLNRNYRQVESELREVARRVQGNN